MFNFLIQGPIWAEVAAATIGKAVVAGVLSAASNPQKIKAVHDTLSKIDLTEEETATEVINIFTEDANK